MSYIIGSKCVSVCDTACVKVCPVDCIDGPISLDGATEEEKLGKQLYINPDVCIDCGACLPECPVDAIVPGHEVKDEFWTELNARLAIGWPVITKKKSPLPEAEEFKAIKDKRHLLEE